MSAEGSSPLPAGFGLCVDAGVTREVKRCRLENKPIKFHRDDDLDIRVAFSGEKAPKRYVGGILVSIPKENCCKI